MDTRSVRGTDKFNDAAVIHTFLNDAEIGLWVIEIEEGALPRMYADDSMLDLLGAAHGLTPEETYDFWFRHIESEYVPMVEKATARIAAMEFAEVHYVYNHPTAGQIYVRCGGSRDPEEHQFISLNGYHQNITDLQEISRSTETLRTNNEMLVYSLSNLFESLYRVDPYHGRVITMRAPDDAILPSDLEYDAFLQVCLPYIHPEDQAGFLQDFDKYHIDEVWRSGANQFTREFRRTRPGGGYRWVAMIIYFCELDDGRKWGILGVRDVDERRTSEEKGRQALLDACKAAEASANAKMEFLSRMSHDVRTPMNAILGMTTLARAVKDDPLQVMSCINKIESAAGVLYHLINEALDMSRIEANEIHLEQEPLSIRELVQFCIHMVAADARKKDISIHLMESVNHDQVLGDHTRLSEIVLNFLTNAVKYTSFGGEVTLTVTELAAVSKGALGYQIDCKDNGIGISEESLPHVFEPFWREEDSRVSKTSGSGLGLAITRTLATLMNGWTSVRSVKGEGSTFTAVVYLDPVPGETLVGVAAETAAQPALTEIDPEAPAEAEEVRLDGLSILVVEDNEINREIAEDLLQMAGARTEGAENGLLAVEAYANHGEDYNAILMDIKMPVMDGNEATRRIREIESSTGRHIPIIALTANSFAEDIAASREAGVDYHMTKPYNQQALFRVIRTFVDAEGQA